MSDIMKRLLILLSRLPLKIAQKLPFIKSNTLLIALISMATQRATQYEMLLLLNSCRILIPSTIIFKRAPPSISVFDWNDFVPESPHRARSPLSIIFIFPASS